MSALNLCTSCVYANRYYKYIKCMKNIFVARFLHARSIKETTLAGNLRIIPIILLFLFYFIIFYAQSSFYAYASVTP